MTQNECQIPCPSRKQYTENRWRGVMRRVRRKHRMRSLEVHTPKLSKDHSRERKGDTWEAGTKRIVQMQSNKAISWSNLQGKTSKVSGPTSHCYLERGYLIHPKRMGISIVLCGVVRFFTLIQKLLLMLLWASFPRDQDGDYLFWFKILSFYSSCWHGRLHAGERINRDVGK